MSSLKYVCVEKWGGASSWEQQLLAMFFQDSDESCPQLEWVEFIKARPPSPVSRIPRNGKRTEDDLQEQEGAKHGGQGSDQRRGTALYDQKRSWTMRSE
ncbi:hypothetical protein PIIN_07901 [Serendipita indica DSM 11827]|uniref:Uncharacterized protein n=1 Tax=Serendipita indica (strain DSM 11827) TaxID=1109443 RepID=G4TRK4_SERID|nr:hypothetical protein PIIN_07901 [Serendipita indica DSM 11827]